MLDLSTRKRESTVFIFWLSIEKDSISLRELREDNPLIEPYSLSMRSVTISDDCLDEKFFISSHLIREKFDRTLYCLFFLNIQHRELREDITLVFIVTWKK